MADIDFEEINPIMPNHPADIFIQTEDDGVEFITDEPFAPSAVSVRLSWDNVDELVKFLQENRPKTVVSGTITMGREDEDGSISAVGGE